MSEPLLWGLSATLLSFVTAFFVARVVRAEEGARARTRLQNDAAWKLVWDRLDGEAKFDLISLFERWEITPPYPFWKDRLTLLGDGSIGQKRDGVSRPVQPRHLTGEEEDGGHLPAGRSANIVEIP